MAACNSQLSKEAAGVGSIDSQITNLEAADHRLQQRWKSLETRQRELELQYITNVGRSLLVTIAQNFSRVNLSLVNAGPDVTTTAEPSITTGIASTTDTTSAPTAPLVPWHDKLWTFNDILSQLTSLLQAVEAKLSAAAARAATTTTEGPSDLDLFGPESDEDAEELARRNEEANLANQRIALQNAVNMLNQSFSSETNGAAVLQSTSGDLLQRQEELRREAKQVGQLINEVRNHTIILSQRREIAQSELDAAESTCNHTRVALRRKEKQLKRSKEFLAQARVAQQKAEQARREYLDYTIQATFNRRRSLSPFFLPEEPPLVVLPCSLYKSCAECTEAPTCGWLVPHTSDFDARAAVLRNPVQRRSGVCVAGNSTAPTLISDFSTPFASYNFDTCEAVSRGIYGASALSDSEPCSSYKGCEQCTKAAGCGFCGSTLQCLPSPHATGNWPMITADNGQRAVLVGREDLGPKHHLLCPNSLSPTWIPGRQTIFARLLDDNSTEQLPVATCAPRQVTLSAPAVAMLLAQRRYEALVAEKNRLIDDIQLTASAPGYVTGSNATTTVWSSHAAKLAKLSRHLEEAADDLRESQFGNVRTFGDGYSAGLRAAEFRNAREIGRLEAELEHARKQPNETESTDSSNGYTVLAKLVNDEISGDRSRRVLAAATSQDNVKQADAIAAAVKKAVQDALAGWTEPSVAATANSSNPQVEGNVRNGSPPVSVAPAVANAVVPSVMPSSVPTAIVTAQPIATQQGAGAATTPAVKLLAPNVTTPSPLAKAAQISKLQAAAVAKVGTANATRQVAGPPSPLTDPVLAAAKAYGAHIASATAVANAAAKAAAAKRAASEAEAAARALLPRITLDSTIELKSIKFPTSSIRHCANQLYSSEKGRGDDVEFRFKVVAALNGQVGAVSFQSATSPYRCVCALYGFVKCCSFSVDHHRDFVPFVNS